MIRSSLLLLLALGTVAQAFRTTHRYRFLKHPSPPPKNTRPTPQNLPGPIPVVPGRFVVPVVPISPLDPPFPLYGTRPVPLPPVPTTNVVVGSYPPGVARDPPGVAVAALVPPGPPPHFGPTPPGARITVVVTLGPDESFDKSETLWG
uniref:Secreted peptide n=1 Tax=Rhipicephalus pulchellus TaxID=72859 RepID=L7MC16_RHIPC